jgi:hypothetical protein
LNARRLNTTLWIAAAVLALGALASIAASLLLPLESAELKGVGQVNTAATKPASVAAIPPMSDLEKVWNANLRQNLGEAAPIQATPVAVQPIATPSTDAGLPVSLVGTIGNSLAMLKSNSNAVDVCAVGETSNGVTVVAVRPAEVDVKYNGKLVTLAKPKEE